MYAYIPVCTRAHHDSMTILSLYAYIRVCKCTCVPVWYEFNKGANRSRTQDLLHTFQNTYHKTVDVRAATLGCLQLIVQCINYLCNNKDTLHLEADVGWQAQVQPPPPMPPATGLRLHLDLQEIQQLEFEFVTRSSHGLQRPSHAVLTVVADGCLAGRTTTDYLYTRCTQPRVAESSTTHRYLAGLLAEIAAEEGEAISKRCGVLSLGPGGWGWRLLAWEAGPGRQCIIVFNDSQCGCFRVSVSCCWQSQAGPWPGWCISFSP